MLCFGLLVAQSGAFAQRNLMPAGFEAIHIGMSWSEVVVARPNAEILDLLPAPGKILKPNLNQPMEGLVENLGDSTRIFKQALYVFENGSLLSVTFSRDLFGEGNVRQMLLEEVSSKYGPPDQVALIRGQSNQAVATWNVNKQLINAILPVRRDIVDRVAVAWQIIDHVYAEKIGAPGISRNATPLTEQERATIELVSREFEKLSPSRNPSPAAHDASVTSIPATSAQETPARAPSDLTASEQETASPNRSQRWIWSLAAAVILTLVITLLVSRHK